MRVHTREVVVAVLCLCAASLTGAAGAAGEGCKLQLLTDLHVGSAPGGAVLVPVAVNGKDAWMALGLHSGISMIREQALERLQLPPKTITLAARTGSRVRSTDSPIIAGKETLQRYVRLDNLRVGQVTFTAFEAVVGLPEERPLPDYQGLPVVGSIGSAAFSKLDLELYLAAERLRIFNPSDCKDPPVYWGLEFTAVPFKYDVTHTMIFKRSSVASRGLL